MELLQPKQLTVLATSQCTAACSHCSMNSAPTRRDRLSAERMCRAISELHERSPLRVVIFAGGEPTLLGESLLDAIAHADSLGITTRIVTNAYWATCEEKAITKIVELRQAGLAELNISVDDFHIPYIPFANVANAWNASKNRGFRSVVIANCYGPKSTINPAYIMDQLGENLPVRFDSEGLSCQLPAPASDGTVYMLSNSYLQILGRSHSILEISDVFVPEHPEALSGPCPWAVRSAALSPKGHLLACCGMEAENNAVLDFGDIIDTDLKDLVAKADQSVIVNAIALLGPFFLQEFIKQREPDVRFRAQYATVCEICEDIVSRQETVAALEAHLPALTAAVLCARIAMTDTEKVAI